VVRQRYFNVSSLHELFDTVNAQSFFYLFCYFFYLAVFTQNVYGTEWPFVADVPLRNYSLSQSTPKIFMDLLEILGFYISCNLTFIHVIDFITAIVLNLL